MGSGRVQAGGPDVGLLERVVQAANQRQTPPAVQSRQQINSASVAAAPAGRADCCRCTCLSIAALPIW